MTDHGLPDWGDGLPAAPPVQPDGGAVQQVRPTWPMAIGIISIIIAAFGILGSIWGIVAPLVLTPFFKETFPEQTTAELIIMIVMPAAGLVLAIWLMSAAIRLVRYTPNARVWLINWSIIKIIYVVLSSMMIYYIQMKSFETMSQNTQGPGPPDIFFQVMPAISACMNLVWGMVLPGFLLIFLTRTSVIRQCEQWFVSKTGTDSHYSESVGIVDQP